MIFDHLSHKLLLQVEKPARYVGGEINSICKSLDKVTAHCALVFPDIYEIGMSCHALRILYELVNTVPQFFAERIYAPCIDMENIMRSQQIGLYSLETHTPASQFDVIGFSLQYELNYTNVLNLLDLAGLPVRTEERSSAFPLIIAGGECTLSPEALAPFIDCFVLGDGEETILELLSVIEGFKKEGDGKKESLLREIAQLKGTYIPSFYDVVYNPDNTFFTLVPKRKDIPVSFQRRIFNIAFNGEAVSPPIPLVRPVHERFTVEVRRGCTGGCRFCPPGIINRPVRERSVDQILDICRLGLKNTGIDGISLLSLSTADYSLLSRLIDELTEEFYSKRISINLPSIRINAFDVDIVHKIHQVKKTGLTFAPEAGTERLRNIINKSLDEDSFFDTVREVIRKGWRLLKLYFVIGLPTETEEDLLGIVHVIQKTLHVAKVEHCKGFELNVTLSPFVPKPHTPFQWEPQLTIEELNYRINFVRDRINTPRVKFKVHDLRHSYLECIFARADRRLASVLEQAWKNGAKFDGWSEMFDWDGWLKAFEQTGIDPTFYANRRRGDSEAFPWDAFDPGIGKNFLLREWNKSINGETTPDCSTAPCVGCAVCGDNVGNIKAGDVDKIAQETQIALPVTYIESPIMNRYINNSELQSEKIKTKWKRDAVLKEISPSNEMQKLSIIYTKTGFYRYVGHLDFCEILKMLLHRSGLPLCYSQGFSPKPVIEFSSALPLGYAGLSEVMDVSFNEKLDPITALEHLIPLSVDGLKFIGSAEIPDNSLKLSKRFIAAQYRIFLWESFFNETKTHQGEFIQRLAQWGKNQLGINKQDFESHTKYITEPIITLESEGRMFIHLNTALWEGNYVDPLKALQQITEIGSLVQQNEIYVERLGFIPMDSEITSEKIWHRL